MIFPETPSSVSLTPLVSLADTESSLTCIVDGGGPNLGVKWYLDDIEVTGEDMNVSTY